VQAGLQDGKSLKYRLSNPLSRRGKEQGFYDIFLIQLKEKNTIKKIL
jgi:hypothetical protein